MQNNLMLTALFGKPYTMSRSVVLFLVVFASLFTLSFVSLSDSKCVPVVDLSDSTDVFIDPRDSQSYDIVKIGNRWWFAENLNYYTKTSVVYSDDKIAPGQWGRYYHYNEMQFVCPQGWHIPNLSDWGILKKIIDEESVYSLMDTTYWVKNDSATNSSGLNLQPYGFKHKRKFINQYLNSTFWFKDTVDTNTHWHLHMDGENNLDPYYFHDHGEELFVRRFAVRCVCDDRR
jgi:uncharacterized protein (TIGR02145 family)